MLYQRGKVVMDTGPKLGLARIYIESSEGYFGIAEK